MRREAERQISFAGRLAWQLRAEKKKALAAFFLLSVMGMLWVRVLSGGPEDAAAAKRVDGEVSTARSSDSVSVRHIELPVIEGRTDVLHRNFFSYGAEEYPGREFDGKAGRNFEGDVRRVFGNLKLEAIELGEAPRAFINDRLVGVGDKLPVRDGKREYVCEVLLIEENRVLLGFGENEVSLEFQALETDEQF